MQRPGSLMRSEGAGRVFLSNPEPESGVLHPLGVSAYSNLGWPIQKRLLPRVSTPGGRSRSRASAS